MATDLTWRQAIDKVLSSSPSAMHYKEIADQIMANGLRKNLGATPAATVNAQITSSIKHDGDASPYIRVDKGTFALRSGTSVSQ
ncbi:MAG: winged helix-turn-helix domain-containing protein, partial [Caldilineales bacterium]|nr:winged helix-turn-helix domain-containing protein [Caldilineales bacterium]